LYRQNKFVFVFIWLRFYCGGDPSDGLDDAASGLAPASAFSTVAAALASPRMW